jgi:hypothetical protein
MTIIILTESPATEKRPAVIINGVLHKASARGPALLAAAVQVRHALYSGQLPEASWGPAERFLNIARYSGAGARGGSATGKRKTRGNAAHYAWLTACREAKRNGLPQPARPGSNRRKASGK